jgi:hypothetical protein
LRKSPPIAPARSIRPGEAPVDARTVMMHAEAMQKAKLAGGPMPAPRTAAQSAYQAATMIGEGVTGPQSSQMAAQQKTRIATGGVPDLAPPQVPQSNTMRIATPVGYSSRPPRKMWPIVLVMGLLLGLGGGAFAVAYFGRKHQPPGDASVATKTIDAAQVATTTDAAPTIDAAVAVVAETVDAAKAVITTPDAAPDHAPTITMAKVMIDSTPPGATVIGPDGKTLGKTPLKIEWPISQNEVSFDLKLSGYKKKTQTMHVDGNTAVVVELEKASKSGTSKGSGSAKGSGDSSNGLMRPDQL